MEETETICLPLKPRESEQAPQRTSPLKDDICDGQFHTNRPMEKDELSACFHPFYFSGNLCDYTHLRGKDSTLLGNLSFLAVEPT